MKEINFFAQTNFRNKYQRFGIRIDDRRRHFYSIGKTGMGKTEMLKNMAIQDIQNGYGMSFIDPHGEASEELLDFVPAERVKDVIYFNPADTAYPIAFNAMEDVGPEYRHLVASGLMSVFKKIWPDVWSARMEYILNNAVLALLEYPGATLLGINRMLSDAEYRAEVVDKVQDPVVKTFWVQEYARYTQRYEVEATAAIQNKVGQFISNPLIRNIIGQERSSIDMREVMDSRKILIANISKGRIGEDNSRLLGALLITKLQLAAMSRVDMPEEERQDFFLYIDEFQNFATDSFVGILSEARKYRLSLILSHQYIGQLGIGADATVRDAVFGNVGTIVSFRVGAEDAEALEKEFWPEITANDFVNLGKYHIYVKLMIDGLASRPFSAETLEPLAFPAQSQQEEIIRASREQYGTEVREVEEKISRWAGVEEMLERVAANPVQPADASTLYDAVCSRCGRDTKVVFPPDGKRPVYCKSCRKKIKQERETEQVRRGYEGGGEQRQAAVSEKPRTPSAVPRVENDRAGTSPERDGAKEYQALRKSSADKRERKPINVDALREALQQAFEIPTPQAGKEVTEDPSLVEEEMGQRAVKQRGSIQPGETVYFNS